MTEDEKWQILQDVARRAARQELLEALMSATGLDEYIAKAIEDHERRNHDA